MKTKYIYKNIKTGEYLHWYDHNEKKYYDSIELNEESYFFESSDYNPLIEGNITSDGNYKIVQYTHELRKIKLLKLKH